MNREELEMLECAAREGRDAGRAAASWMFDGNTSAETFEAFRRGLEDGDPAILDQIPHADLSGEWADSPTPRRLAEACGLEEDSDPDGTFLAEMCRAYEDAFDSAALAEIERTLSVHLS